MSTDPMTDRKILITGGAGFIGYHLATHLLDAYGGTARITLVDNLSRGRKDAELEKLLCDSRVTFVPMDLTDHAAYENFSGGYHHVYHLAAINGTKHFYERPHETLRTNTLSLIHMLEWFRVNNADGKFCFTSSNEAYAGGLAAFGVLPIPTPERVPLVIEDPYNPRWSYAATKLIGELFLIHYANAHRLRALIVRPHNFYGPRAGYDHVIPEISMRITATVDPFPVFGADETRTFCYIGDAVRAMRMLMDSSKTDTWPIETVHIGDTHEITMQRLAHLLFEISGWKPKVIETHPAPAGSVKRRLADITTIQNLVGWRPEVSLTDGLRRTLEWYRSNAPRSSFKPH